MDARGPLLGGPSRRPVPAYLAQLFTGSFKPGGGDAKRSFESRGGNGRRVLLLDALAIGRFTRLCRAHEKSEGARCGRQPPECGPQPHAAFRRIKNLCTVWLPLGTGSHRSRPWPRATVASPRMRVPSSLGLGLQLKIFRIKKAPLA